MLWDTAGQEEFDCITKAYYRWKHKTQKHKPQNTRTENKNHKGLLQVETNCHIDE